jgi:hypothetical protein
VQVTPWVPKNVSSRNNTKSIPRWVGSAGFFNKEMGGLFRDKRANGGPAKAWLLGGRARRIGQSYNQGRMTV